MENDVSNLINNFKTILSNNSTDATNNASFSDFNISPEMISNLKQMLNNSNGDSSSPPDSTSSIDFDTLLKMKNIVNTLNRTNDPRSNLLYSLKPYLRESRQNKIDQYVNLLKISSLSDLFKNSKGDDS